MAMGPNYDEVVLTHVQLQAGAPLLNDDICFRWTPCASETPGVDTMDLKENTYGSFQLSSHYQSKWSFWYGSKGLGQSMITLSLFWRFLVIIIASIMIKKTYTITIMIHNLFSFNCCLLQEVDQKGKINTFTRFKSFKVYKKLGLIFSVLNNLKSYWYEHNYVYYTSGGVRSLYDRWFPPHELVAI